MAQLRFRALLPIIRTMGGFANLSWIAPAMGWALVIVALLRGERTSWPWTIAAIAALNLAVAWPPRHYAPLVLEAVALIVALWLALARARGAAISPTDAPVAEALPELKGRALRALVDRGVWVNGSGGDVLIAEGKPLTRLYLVASGAAAVTIAGRAVGTCGPGQFAGEVTIMSGDPATATVTLSEPSRLWCIDAEELRAAARLHADVRAAIEAAIRRSLAEKLLAANRMATDR